jgi:hypothetical protein
MQLKVSLPNLAAGGEVAALARGTLARLEGKPAGAPGEYRLPSSLGKGFFLAVKTGDRLVVGWPKAAESNFTALVQAALPESEDFFDVRRLLGVFHDEQNAALYSLMLSARKGNTTLAETRSQPWRLEIYRWKLDDDGQRVMLAGKGYFFRGIGAKNEPVPTVELSDKLWHLHQRGEKWVAGEE